MPRTPRYSAGGAASSMHSVDMIISKENDYRSGIKENHALSSIFAEMLSHGGAVETSMLQAIGDDQKAQEEIQTFLTLQRDRLKKVSERNVQANRTVDGFLASLKEMRTHVQGQGGASQETDYETMLKDSMQKYHDSRKNSNLELRDEELCRDIRSKLNEKEASRSKKKRKNRNAEEEEDSDDDLEIVNLPSNPESTLKCPITGKLYEDPVKSKVCKHIYSRAGFQQVLRSGRPRCPVAGCGNTRLTADQVEPDPATSMKVRKFVRNMEREKQLRASQAADVDDDEEEAVL